MQTDKRNLTRRAKMWNACLKAQFQSVPLPPAQPMQIPDDIEHGKWF